MSLTSLHQRTRFVLVLILIGIASRLNAAEGAAPRWNILFIFADDWGRYASAYAGLDGRSTAANKKTE